MAALATVVAAATAAPAASAAPPANDLFANAATIALDGSGHGGITNGTTIDATFEPGEPLIRSENSGSVWYRITPSVDAPLVVDTCTDADFDTMIGVYTGAGVSALSTVTQNDDSVCDSNRSQANFIATAGTTYWIQVRGYGDDAGDFALRIAPGLAALDVERNFDNPVSPSRTPIVFSADDNGVLLAGAVAHCRLDGGPSQVCGFPYRLPNATALADGSHTLQVVLTYGGFSSPPGDVTFTVDGTPPTVTVDGAPADGATQALPMLWALSASEPLDGIECTIDGYPTRCSYDWVNNSEVTVEIADLCAGPHEVAVLAIDEAGNPSAPVRRTVTASDGGACAAPTFLAPPNYEFNATNGFSSVAVDPHGAGSRLYLEYGTTPEYGERLDVERGPRTEGGDGGVEIAFLEPGTTYHARWTAENPSGLTRSADFTFTTDAASGPPLVTALRPVTGLGTTVATLNGTIPYDRWTRSRFEYGTTPSYGTRVLADSGLNGVYAELTGLEPNTTYHYRMHTISDENATRTPDATFTTDGDGKAPPQQPELPKGIPGPPVDNRAAPPAPSKSAEAKRRLADALKRVKLTRKQLRKGGRLTFRVKTIGAGTVKVSGKVRRGKAKKSVSLGARSAKLEKAGTATVRVKISKKARSQARRKGRLTVTLSARFAGSGVKSVSATRTIKLR